ncbi:MAG TPA: hypothetical protein VM864_04135 [Pyrinomonadaceae bacterium]|jgi:hypothetical protein|nr:hypothetical protein [Pyrinomonadaceae bacterium]
MNAAGLKFTLTSVASVINSGPFFDGLTSQGVSAAELSGTREDANALVKALNTTPPEKIEAIVAQYDAELTPALERFQGDWAANRLQGFRDAQVMIGLVTSVFNKAGIDT